MPYRRCRPDPDGQAQRRPVRRAPGRAVRPRPASVHFAAAGLIAGHYDIAVAGGVESMSRVPMGAAKGDADPLGPLYAERYGTTFPNQGIGAEDIAERWGISRQQMDEFDLASHEKAAAATDGGRFESQIVPVTTADRVVTVDEGIRRATTLERL